MAIPPTPLYQSKGNVPYIPTGYEGLRSDIANKRKIADALNAAGLAGPGVNARSWVQLLGSLAQSFAGTMMDRKANREETDMNNNISINQGVSEANFNSAQAMGATNDELIRQFGSDQNLQDNPMMKIVQELALKSHIAKGDPTRMKDSTGNFTTTQGYEDGSVRPVMGGYQLGPKIDNVNDVATALQEQAPGTPLPRNFNQDVILGPDGKPQINTAKVVASVASQGGLLSAPGVTWGDGSQTSGGLSGAAPGPVASAPGVAGVTNALANRKGGFAEAIKTILGNEGGYAAHDMNGSPVNFGINQAANPGVDVRNLTQDQAIQIYHDKYWVKSGAETLPPNLQAPYFDAYIRNPSKAQQFLQASGGDPATFVGMATSYFKDLAARPGNEKYQRAYATRDAQNMAIATGGQAVQGNSALPPSAGNPPFTVTGAIPGTPMAGRLAKTTMLSPAEVTATGLDPTKAYQRHPDGSISSIGDKGGTEEVLGDMNKTGHEYLQSLPPGDRGFVQAIVDGRFPISTKMTSPNVIRYFKEAAMVDPSVDASTYQRRVATQRDFASGGKSGQSVTSARTVINHLFELASHSDKLGGSDLVGVNAVANWLKSQDSNVDLKGYNATLTPLSMELPKFLGGKAPTIPEIAQTRADFAASAGPAARRKQIETTLNLMSGRFDPMVQSYNQGMNSNSDISFLLEQASGGGSQGKQASSRLRALQNYVAGGKLEDPQGGSTAHGPAASAPIQIKIISRRKIQ